MKTLLNLFLAVSLIGAVAVGCAPAEPQGEAPTTTTDTKKPESEVQGGTEPAATTTPADGAAKPAEGETKPAGG